MQEDNPAYITVIPGRRTFVVALMEYSSVDGGEYYISKAEPVDDWDEANKLAARMAARLGVEVR